MKQILQTLAIALCISLVGCVNSNLAWRGIVYYQDQDAATEGTITNQPKSGDAKVEAAKEYTDAFKANTAVDTDKKPEEISKEVKAE